MQEEQLAEYAQALEAGGFLTKEAPAGTWPDQPTVGIYSDDDGVLFVLLCANQCLRDQQHGCGIPLALSELTDPTWIIPNWIQSVGQKIPWMVLSWGLHLHQLPFCSANCLIAFVERRASDGGMRRNGHH